MFKIKMAGLTIQINNRYQYVRYLCRDYITDTDAVDFTVSASEDEILAELANDETSTPDYCESLCVYRNICLKLPDYDAFLIHGAAVAVDGQAYLFLAKSGVGKSTHARLWAKTFGDRLRIVNGDKPILRRIEDRWHVCGTPWQGKENWGSNTTAPVKALCFLERGRQNTIIPISDGQVSGRIFHQLLMPKTEEQLSKFFALLEDLLEKTPAFLLHCNREAEAAMVAYKGMQQRQQ